MAIFSPRMKLKFRFEYVYRFGLVVLLVVAFWSVWANAQPTTPHQLTVVHRRRHWAYQRIPVVSFWFDHIDYLKTHQWLGQPLWKYPASLTYIVLAFFVAWFLDFIVSAWIRRFAAR